ncbi:ChuX/HutX family heme-like substrate-binding protein [uncultured Thermosynechococcus sp.]|uniref:ChuX/HutX family heme-like substrate-binding protein n=1 Tax=uncultured Thermosynechococcus sp. TaxID=436945 RepID=UPI00263720E3|nr:ChuX/HutX family heme-like substrate-binding protein [uncultured Thermosynechococcus sp.]
MSDTSLSFQQFLSDCEQLGLLRLVVTNEVAVLEVRSPLSKVFYAELPKGRYANMHTEDFEFHLNMDQVAKIRFEEGQAKRGNFPTYAIRFLDSNEKSVLSAFLQWGKPGEYAAGQVAAWQALRERYGTEWQPLVAALDSKTSSVTHG